MATIEDRRMKQVDWIYLGMLTLLYLIGMQGGYYIAIALGAH